MTDKPHVLAFFLPQFHAIPENDLWWGQGFTEWTNVRKARPLFPGHRQPRTPQNENYYNLLDPATREWQAALAREHGLSGFCYYHYWFAGRQLLETPINSIIASGTPDFPFCLAWANEPWTRAWDGSERDVLMPQDYGDEVDWHRHFDYLDKAFSDPRYIRLDGRPVLLIYRTPSIKACGPMLALWRRLAIERGHPGLHVVSMRTIYEDDTRLDLFDATMNFEPNRTFNALRGLPRLREVFVNRLHRTLLYRFGRRWWIARSRNAGAIWRHILQQDVDARCYPGAFVDWDNTPRKGAEGWVLRNASPSLFRKNFERLFEKARRAGAPFIFVNAWNEWAEGTYLEPDAEYETQYLEAIKAVVGK